MQGDIAMTNAKDEQTKARFELVSENLSPKVSGSIFDDLAALRKTPKLAIKRTSVLVNVEVGTPSKDVHFRAHPEWALDDQYVVKDDHGTFYFVPYDMRSHPKLVKRLRLVTIAVVAIWPADTVQIWPVPVLGQQKRDDHKAWKSARNAYELSKEQWVQLAWNEAKGDYDVEVAERITATPNWPDKTFEELLKLGFAEKILDSEDHDYVRQLRGLD
jgi:hypothetical protein